MDKDIKIKIKAEDNASKTIGDLQRELKEANAELLRATKGTKEWNDAFKKVASLKDEMRDLKEAIKTSASSLDAIQRSTQTFVGGMQALEGAMALVGSESEELTKTLVRLQALSNIADGIKSFDDFGKTLNSLKVTILANPIFIIAGVITTIGVVLYELRDRIQVVGKAFEWIGGIIGKVIDAVKDVADSIGIYNKKLDALESKKKQLETLNDKEIFQLEQQQKIQQALGKSTIDIEIKKIELLQQRIKAQIDNLELIAKERKLTDEELNQLNELKKKYTETQTDMIIAEANKQKEIDEKRKEAHQRYLLQLKEQEKAQIKTFEATLKQIDYYSNEQIKLAKITGQKEIDIQIQTTQAKISVIDKEIERIQKQKNVDKERLNELLQQQTSLNNDLVVLEQQKNEQIKQQQEQAIATKREKEKQTLAERLQELEYQKQLELLTTEQTIDSKIAVEQKYYDAQKQLILQTITDKEQQTQMLTELERKHNITSLQLAKEKADKEKQLRKQQRDDEVMISRASLNAIDSLQNAFFTIAKQRAKQNSEEAKRLERAQFNIAKGVNIAKAIMNTAEAVTKDLAKGFPIGPILAGIDAAIGAAQIATIIAQKFPETTTDSGAPAAPNVPSAGSSGVVSTSDTQPLQPLLPQGFSTDNLQEKDKQEIKAIVVETDIRSTQRRVNSIIESSSF
ncbi:MAG: hypothetical protein QXF76_02710 [Candidatus Anstonellales archaeon]